MSAQWAYYYHKIFSLYERTVYWNPSYLGVAISKTRFEKIMQHLTLKNDEIIIGKKNYWVLGILVFDIFVNVNKIQTMYEITALSKTELKF